jgi:hypothetical protein
MKLQKEYIQYHSFLNAIENEVAAMMSISDKKEQLAMFRVCEMVMENFRKIYGDEEYSDELLKDTKRILDNYNAELN